MVLTSLQTFKFSGALVWLSYLLEMCWEICSLFQSRYLPHTSVCCCTCCTQGLVAVLLLVCFLVCLKLTCVAVYRYSIFNYLMPAANMPNITWDLLPYNSQHTDMRHTWVYTHPANSHTMPPDKASTPTHCTTSQCCEQCS